MSEDSEKRVQRRRVRQWWQSIDADLPSGFIPLEAVVSVKGIDAASGEIMLHTRKTPGMPPWEAYGILGYSLEEYSSANCYDAATEDDE